MWPYSFLELGSSREDGLSAQVWVQCQYDTKAKIPTLGSQQAEKPPFRVTTTSFPFSLKVSCVPDPHAKI